MKKTFSRKMRPLRQIRQSNGKITAKMEGNGKNGKNSGFSQANRFQKYLQKKNLKI